VSAGLLKADLAYGSFFLRANPANPVEEYFDIIASRPNELLTEWAHSSGDGLAPNFRAGLLLKPTPDLRLGASFSLPVNVTLEGNSYFYFYMPDIPEYHNRTDVFVFPDAMNNILSSGATYFVEEVSFESEVTLPAQLSGGIAYQLSDRLLVSGGLDYTLWSQFEGYEFKYEFSNPSITRNDTLNLWMAEDMVVPADWSNTFRGSLGIEYAYNDAIKLRTGYSADQSPNSQELDEVFFLHPAFFDTGLKHGIHGGLGITFENVILDFAAQYIFYPDTYQGANKYLEVGGESGKIITNMPGDYSGSALESAVQFTLRF
jgi:long-subunit fatty acid transport protein